MRRFTELLGLLSSDTPNEQKVAGLVDYLRGTAASDAMWVVYHLLGKRPVRAMPVERLKAWGSDRAGIAGWMIDECVEGSGNACEGMALLLDTVGVLARDRCELSVGQLFEEVIPAVAGGGAAGREILGRAWSQVTTDECIQLHKIVTGRVALVSRGGLLSVALGRLVGIPTSAAASRLHRFNEPTLEEWQSVMTRPSPADVMATAYPFREETEIYEIPPEAGDVADWFVANRSSDAVLQIAKRRGEVFVWDESSVILTDSFSEFAAAARSLPGGTVIECVVVDVPAAEGTKGTPLCGVVRDILECEGEDLRSRPWKERRRALDKLWQEWDRCPGEDELVQGSLFEEVSDAENEADPFELERGLPVRDWREVERAVERSRADGAIGVRLTRRDSLYTDSVEWWKPMALGVIAVLTSVKPNLRTDLPELILSVWTGENLVPVATLPFEEDSDERAELDQFVCDNTSGRRGPILDVRPELLFELEFDDVESSNRHRSGILLRNARIVRWCRERAVSEVGRLEELTRFLAAGS